MTGAPSTLADLLADCAGHGIRLLAADGGGLTVDAPQNGLTPDLIDRLRRHKAGILALLSPESKTARLSPYGDAAPLSPDGQITSLSPCGEVARLSPYGQAAPPAVTADPSPTPPQAVCRCGSAAWVDVPIHAGQSVRRDCARCNRFIEFSVWYGADRHAGIEFPDASRR